MKFRNRILANRPIAIIALTALLILPIVWSARPALADAGSTVSGAITFTDNGQPVSMSGNLNVNIYNPGSCPGGNTNTDSTGYYAISTLARCQYYTYITGSGTLDNNGTPSTFRFNTLRSDNNFPVDGTNNVTENYPFAVNLVKVTVKDMNGNPVAGAEADIQSYDHSGTTTSDGANGFGPAGGPMITESAYTNSDGVAYFSVFTGKQYSISSYYGGQTYRTDDYRTPINLDRETTVYVGPLLPRPASVTTDAPAATNQYPISTSWTPVDGAVSYNVYRGYNSYDGFDFFANTTDTSIIDNGPLTDSYHVYCIATVNAVGLEGPRACGNGFVFEQNPPTLGTPSFSANPIGVGDNTTLTVPTSNDAAGIARAEYYIGDTDPGMGNATAMTVDGSNLTANLGADLPIGTYSINIRAQDNAGNWSTVTVATLHVTLASPANLTAPTPTTQPVLTWDTVSGATSYNIYRDGTNIGSIAAPISGTTATYTDTTATDGPYDYYVTTVGSGEESNPSSTVTVTLGVVPTITSGASASTGMLVPFSFLVTTSGSPTANLTESGNLPAGITFTDNGDGTAIISGEAQSGTDATYPITINASNGMSSGASQSFVLTVNSTTSAPTITSSSSATTGRGQVFNFQVTTTGYPAPSIKKAGALPKGLTWKAGTDTISGTVASNAKPGTYTITLTAKNSSGTATQTFVLTVQ